MKIASISRFPIKSLGGESRASIPVQVGGLEHDRALALWDVARQCVVSRKNPRRYPMLGDFSACVDGRSMSVLARSGVEIRLDEPDAQARLSRALGFEVTVLHSPPEGATIHRLWPPVAGLAPEAARSSAVPTTEPDVTAGPLGILAPGTFFDVAPLHIVTTSGLSRLAASTGQEVEAVRFRANLVIDDGNDLGFTEDALSGHDLHIGHEVVLQVSLPTPRCVVPSAAYETGVSRPDILRVLAREHRTTIGELGQYATFGVYATVKRPGIIAVGDPVESRVADHRK